MAFTCPIGGTGQQERTNTITAVLTTNNQFLNLRHRAIFIDCQNHTSGQLPIGQRHVATTTRLKLSRHQLLDVLIFVEIFIDWPIYWYLNEFKSEREVVIPISILIFFYEPIAHTQAIDTIRLKISIQCM